jgi:hypothetical protein
MAEMRTRTGQRHRIISRLAPGFLVFLSLLSGCGSGDTVYVAMGTPDSFGSPSDMKVVTLADLDLSSEAPAAIESIYKKYDGLIKDKSDRNQLMRLIASRDAEVCATIVHLMPMDTLLYRGMPMRVCRDPMSDLDEAFYGSEEAHSNLHCGWVK